MAALVPNSCLRPCFGPCHHHRFHQDSRCLCLSLRVVQNTPPQKVMIFRSLVLGRVKCRTERRSPVHRCCNLEYSWPSSRAVFVPFVESGISSPFVPWFEAQGHRVDYLSSPHASHLIFTAFRSWTTFLPQQLHVTLCALLCSLCALLPIRSRPARAVGPSRPLPLPFCGSTRP